MDALEDRDVGVRFRRCRLVGACHRLARGGIYGSFPFHLRTALVRPGREHALSGRDGRASQDGLRAPGAAHSYRKRLSRLTSLFRRIRREVGQPRSGKPSQSSHPRQSVRHCLAGHLFHHHDRRRDETTPSRQRIPAGGHFTLQGTHHGRRRPAWIPHVRSLNRERSAAR